MSSFHERQKNLFNHLKNAEDQYGFSKTHTDMPPPDYGVIDRQKYRRLKREMKQFRGKESIFKKQDANIRECLRAKAKPGYIKNPNKWVYYSLADVTPEQMSEATNTATALAIIQQIEAEETNKTEISDDKDSDAVFKKPMFHVSSTIKKVAAPKNNEAVFKNNKIIMPEYVVGLSCKKEKKVKLARTVSQDSTEAVKKAELKLNHLYEDDEEK